MPAEIMMHGTSLEDLKGRLEETRARVADAAKGCWDEVLPLEGGRFGREGAVYTFTIHGHTYPLVGNAVETLCSRIDLPMTFLSRCAELGLVDHATATIQAFLDAQLAKRPEYRTLLRFRETAGGPAIRAFCGEKYGRFDNQTAFEMLFDTLPPGLGEPVALTTYCEDDMDDLRGTLLFPSLGTRRDDSEYYVGLYYKNSEVCRAAFGVRPFLFRSFCTNTAIWGRTNAGIGDISIRHWGEIDLENVRTQLAAAIDAVVNNGPNLLQLLGYAEEVPVKNVEQVIPYLSRENSLPPPVCRTWLAAYEAEPNPTAAGVVNGLTRAAQEYAGSRRLEMEEIAGEILAPKLTAGPKEVAGLWDYQSRAARSWANAKPERFAKYIGAELNN